MKISESFTLRTVRKKILLVSKLAGILLILSWLLAQKLPLGPDWSFAVWFLFVIVIVLAVDWLMAHFISKPIDSINRTARNIANLDFTALCPVSTHDEFGELAQSLNTMAANLQQTLSRLETVNHRLETVNSRLEEEVEQERKLLAERKFLVDSLSHEMKTPLGIIRAYAEGLQDNTDEAARQKYAGIIIGETERMSRLIHTLLDLSALETGAVSLHPERFDFVEFLETVAGRLLIDVPDTHFTLEYELPEEQIYVYTDKARMEQVLDNLIVNAMKNVQTDGLLQLSLTEQSGTLYFHVYNQGRPIPKEKLPEIWNKFYRDHDTGYSGSGLGLAIVAQILSMQGLKYGVENLSDGVRFYFNIPVVE